jgi:hypothetical protein
MTLNLNENLTVEKVKQFIASCDDSVNRQIRVTQGGIVFISDTIAAQNIEGTAFRLETFIAGNDYLGIKASEDSEWVERIYNVLKKNWPTPSSSFIDLY